jgi:hypothetical protein
MSGRIVTEKAASLRIRMTQNTPSQFDLPRNERQSWKARFLMLASILISSIPSHCHPNRVRQMWLLHFPSRTESQSKGHNFWKEEVVTTINIMFVLCFYFLPFASIKSHRFRLWSLLLVNWTHSVSENSEHCQLPCEHFQISRKIARHCKLDALLRPLLWWTIRFLLSCDETIGSASKSS